MKTAIAVDAGEHIPLIYRVIHQMHLVGDTAEEAFSEALVAITVAAQTYDPGYNVPVANWLARNIRWSLQTWLHKQHATVDISIIPIENTRETLQSKTELNDVLMLARNILTPMEYEVIMADAAGYSGREIAKHLGMPAVWVSRTKFKGQEKMRNNFLE